MASAETAETTDVTDKKADIPNTTTGTAQTVSQAGTGYSVSDIAKNCMPSIVAITTKRELKKSEVCLVHSREKVKVQVPVLS